MGKRCLNKNPKSYLDSAGSAHEFFNAVSKLKLTVLKASLFAFYGDTNTVDFLDWSALKAFQGVLAV